MVATSLPLAAPALGTLVVQLVGSGTTASAVLVLSGSSYTVYLNSGNALASGALYEFTLTLAKGDQLVAVNNATLVRAIFVWTS